jgi:hypothetical protein
MVTKSAKFINTPIRLLIAVAIIAALFGVSIPKTVYADSTDNIVFTANWVSGVGGDAKVYFVVGGGAPQLEGRVSPGSSASFSFPVLYTGTGDESLRVFVDTTDVYSEKLFVNGNEVIFGKVGIVGLTVNLQTVGTDSDGDNDGD